MKEQEAEPHVETSNSFTRVLSEFRSGASVGELSQNLQQLLSAVQETGKGGELIYKIKVKPASTGNEAVVLTDEIKLKSPVAARDAAIFFVTDDFTLVRDNPNQLKLHLREVQGSKSEEAREVIREAQGGA